ncbi:hypothetical protein ACWDBP_00220 [Streptomyces sp. NPDC001233]|uniref:hypothetical protein n=1 Tax=Streptomyces sp. NPDC001127 TaxID=3154377 RepID=UPI003318EED1
MVQRYCLFGSSGTDLREVCDALEISLGVSFVGRESSFKGGRYYLARAEEFEKITVEANWVDEEGYLAEGEFSAYSTLVYVTNPTGRVLSVLENSDYLQPLRTECVD